MALVADHEVGDGHTPRNRSTRLVGSSSTPIGFWWKAGDTIQSNYLYEDRPRRRRILTAR